MDTRTVRQKIEELRQTGSTALDLNGMDLGVLPFDELYGIAGRLTGLDISNNNLTDESVIWIGNNCPALESLRINSPRWFQEPNRITRGSIEGVAAKLKKLRQLELTHNALTNQDIENICAASHQLLNLDLSNNLITADGVRFITAQVPDLTSLSLNFNLIGSEGLFEIFKHLHRLSALSVAYCKIDAFPFTNHHDSREMVHFVISGNWMQNNWSAAALKGSNNLIRLEVENCNLSDIDLENICKHGVNLKSLKIGGNSLGTAHAIRIGISLKELQYLSFIDNNLDGHGLVGLLQNLSLLKQLYVNNNIIRDLPATDLTEKALSLTSLGLSKNQISDQGIRQICALFPNLTELDLFVNRIGNNGAEAIGQQLKSLSRLYLNDNKITDKGTGTHRKFATIAIFEPNQQ